MKSIRRLSSLILLAVFGLLLADLVSSVALAQDAAAVAAAAPANPTVGGDLVDLLIAKAPGWVGVALSIFGGLSVAYQAVIAWAHKRAAETADPADDAWIASLEAKGWFRLLDRVFYWGGYLGARIGGKKL